ncbi:MAG: DUF4349 domain-containing protein [Elainella sp. Prado103]|jgi:hypothetical protein|nr:DUF4349 domain-containing protein [Elainella sp. Prado103]
MAASLLRFPLRLFLLITLLSVMVSACRTVPSSSTHAPQRSVAESIDSTGAGVDGDRATPEQAVAPSPASALLPTQPQLVKTGTLTLMVDSVEQTIEKIRVTVQQQQGDLLELQDQLPGNSGSRHTAVLSIRVPQQNLETMLKGLKQIGIMQQQTIRAEDVANQLVDYQARLRNLRKTETTLLEIMERSGNMTDVLKVAQELSNIRQAIEQVDAQLKDLQNRVAYSVVTIHLQQATTTVPMQPEMLTQAQEAWQQATHSVGQFTVSLMKLGLWLLAYSPYGFVLMLSVLLVHRWRSIHRSQVSNPELPPSN